MTAITHPAPAGNRAVAVPTNQPVPMVADTTSDWFVRTNGGGWTQFASGANQAVWAGASSVTNRWTFDRVEIAIGEGSPSEPTIRHFNLCEGPVACLWATDQLPNPALEAPPLRPWDGEDDDPPLGTPLVMPGADRGGMGTTPCESASELGSGGPVSLLTSYDSGVSVDTSGRLGLRTPFTNDVRGLGPFPAVAAYYHSGLYFQHDFGKSRTLGLTRVLYQDGASHVAVVRGDGRRNTYRWTGSAFEAAAGLQNTLALDGSDFVETSPSGRVYRYSSAGRLQRVVDRCGNPVYYTYDANSRLQKIVPVGGSGALGLVPYLSYDGGGLLTRLVLEDPGNAANNRVTYLQYDGDANLTRILGPEGCVTYFQYADPLRLSAVTRPENRTWQVGYDGNGRVSHVEDARASVAYFAWNTASPQATLRDRAGKVTYLQHDAYGAPVVVFNPGTPADYHSYDGDGNMTGSQNRVGGAWAYQVDPRANRISSTDPLGARSYFAFDGQDLLRRYVDPLGRTTYLDFDGQRNRTVQVDQVGAATYFAYEPTGLLRETKDRRGGVSKLGWDARGNVERAVDPLGSVSYFAYNPANERTAQVDPLGRVSYMDYDRRGRVVKTVSPIGAASYFAYDDACLLVQEKDALLRVTDHQYDPNQNRERTLLPAVGGVRNPTYWAYDPEDRVTSQRNARLFATTWEYDALGRRQKQTDPLGGVTYFGYTDAHQPQVQLDPRNNPTYFAYDPAGRLTRQKNALQEEVYFGFNPASERVLELDALGRPTYHQYDPRGWLEETKTAIGAVARSVFDPEGNRVRSVDPLGLATYFRFDLVGRPTHTEDQLGEVTYVGYDRAGQSVLRVDQLGAPTYMSYDPAGRAQATLSPAGLLTYMAYDLVGNVVAQSLDQGYGRQPFGVSPYGGERATTYMAYDALDRRTATTDALGGVSSSVFDRNGNVLVQIDARGFGTYFEYDPLDRRVATKDGVHFAQTYLVFDPASNVVRSLDQQGQTTYFSPDALNRVAFRHDLATGLLTYHVWDQVGNQTEQHVLLGAAGPRRSTYFQYDLVSRQTRRIAADGGQTYMGYDLGGNQTLVVDPEGRPTYMAFDELNRQSTRRNAFDDTWTTEYDARSSVSLQLDPEGRATYLGYDLAGRLLHQSNALGEYTYFFHDARGQRALVRNPRGFETTFRHDLLGRQTHRVDALGGVAYMAHDPTGNRTLTLDEKGNPTYFAHDGLGRLSRSTDTLGGVTYLGYDSRSSMVLRVDGDGRATYMAYDGARRLERTWFESPGTTLARPIYYSYDPVGNLLESDDTLANLGVSTFEYDPMDRLLKKVTVAGPVYYTYDLSGLKTSVKDPNEDEILDEHDEAGRLVKTTTIDYDPEDPPVVRENDFYYDRAGLIAKKVLADDKVVSYFYYDEAGRLAELLNLDSTGAPITSQVYQRNPNGAVTRVAHENGEFTYYSYDALDRLVEERRVQNPTVYGFAYQYDAASNRTQRADLVTPAKTTDYVVNALNLIQSETSDSVQTVYEYDQAQRMTRRASPSLATYFTHDERDLPTKLEFESTGDFTDDPREFHYTGTGERAVIVGELGGTAPTLLAYDGTKLLTERMPSGFTWGQYRWAGGSLIGSESQESDNFEGPVMDERGSVERLAGVSGQAIYDRFGVELVNNLGSLTRTRFVSPVFLRLNTTGERFSLTPSGVYLASLGRLCATVRPEGRLCHALGLGSALHWPLRRFMTWQGERERRDDRDDPRDEPLPNLYGEHVSEPFCDPENIQLEHNGAISGAEDEVNLFREAGITRLGPVIGLLGGITWSFRVTFSVRPGSTISLCQFEQWGRGYALLHWIVDDNWKWVPGGRLGRPGRVDAGGEMLDLDTAPDLFDQLRKDLGLQPPRTTAEQVEPYPYPFEAYPKPRLVDGFHIETVVFKGGEAWPAVPRKTTVPQVSATTVTWQDSPGIPRKGESVRFHGDFRFILRGPSRTLMRTATIDASLRYYAGWPRPHRLIRFQAGPLTEEM
ncbi:MAG: hypothetical protein M9894_17570 [Planctomycetes bacterium]|nr:hypothetical protein [Planctomycetota bacterium]